MTDHETEIADLIVRETTAFLMRDFPAWADCWGHHEHVRRLGALSGGVVDYVEGWETGSALVQRIFARHPAANPDAAASMVRTNMSFRVGQDMAWVSFDQFAERSGDPLVAVGLSHQIRVCEFQEGSWKITMAGHAEVGHEHVAHPVIRIDSAGRIEWANKAAEAELPNHPALARIGGFLRCRYPGDERRFRAAVKEMATLTALDRRPSIDAPRGRVSDPVVLAGEAADGHHVVWIAADDGLLLVSFRDRRNELVRIEQASRIFELSDVQKRACALVLEGRGIPQIAEALGVRPSTARTHLNRAFDKTGVRSQSALVSRLLGLDAPG